jgi:hypothetical protein
MTVRTVEREDHVRLDVKQRTSYADAIESVTRAISQVIGAGIEDTSREVVPALNEVRRSLLRRAYGMGNVERRVVRL